MSRWILCLAVVSAIAVAPMMVAEAQPKPPVAKKKAGKKKATKPARKRPRKKQPASAKDKVYDFTGIDLVGRIRSPQLLYFLDRASQELELASLERRSFIPEMALSLDQEGL